MRNHAREFGTRPFDDATRDIARAVIVEGRAAVEVASKFGVSRQRVNQLVKRYYEALQNSELTDADVIVWLKHGFEVPSSLIEPLARFLAKAQRSKDTNKVQSAVATLIKNLGAQTSKLE